MPDFTVLDRDELCEACLKASLYQSARAEYALAPADEVHLCEQCGRLDRARRREAWTFDQAVLGWDELVSSAENTKVRVPIKMLLPNGTVVETDAILSTNTSDEHGNTLNQALYCTLDPKTVIFLASARHYPLRTESDETLHSLAHLAACTCSDCA